MYVTGMDGQLQYTHTHTCIYINKKGEQKGKECDEFQDNGWRNLCKFQKASITQHTHTQSNQIIQQI